MTFETADSTMRAALDYHSTLGWFGFVVRFG